MYIFIINSTLCRAVWHVWVGRQSYLSLSQSLSGRTTPRTQLQHPNNSTARNMTKYDILVGKLVNCTAEKYFVYFLATLQPTLIMLL